MVKVEIIHKNEDDTIVHAFFDKNTVEEARGFIGLSFGQGFFVYSSRRDNDKEIFVPVHQIIRLTLYEK